MAELSHLDEAGAARMVDVGSKATTHRVAVAEAFISVSDETRELLMTGGLEKGDAIAVARVAGIMAAKQTPTLIPLCHPIDLTRVDVGFRDEPGGVRIVAQVETSAPTGVEMEALTAAATAALTLYDMVKSREKGAEIGPVRLMSKSGGRSGEWHR